MYLVKSSTYLYEHGEIDHCNSSCQEYRLEWDVMRVDGDDKSKGHSSSETTITHHKLVHEADLLHSKSIAYSAEDEHS